MGKTRHDETIAVPARRVFDAGWASAKRFCRCCATRSPRALPGRWVWWYVFGSASLTLLMVQILTGIGLALVYVPAADEAYNSLLYLELRSALRLVSAPRSTTMPAPAWSCWCWRI